MIFEDGFESKSNKRKEQPDVRQVELCKKFILEHGRKLKNVSKRNGTTYMWKHVAEKVVGEYITNGAFIQAAIELGFTVKQIPGRPTGILNMSVSQAFKRWLAEEHQYCI
jgi:hypothetical protein